MPKHYNDAEKKKRKRAGGRRRRPQQDGSRGEVRRELKERRVGAIDELAKKREMTQPGGPAPRPMGGPQYLSQDQAGMQVQPAVMPAPQPAVQPAQYTVGAGVAQPVQPGVPTDAYGQPVPQPAPQPAVDPAMAVQPEPALAPGPPQEQGAPEVFPAVQPAETPAMDVLPPEQQQEAQIMGGPEVLSPEEQQVENDMSIAAQQGKAYNIRPLPVTPAEQFQKEAMTSAFAGAGIARTPRDVERLRRKRLALLNPKAQQVRPWGRGIPQIRYSEGPAFQGSAGFGAGAAALRQRMRRPQPQAQRPAMPERRPIVR